MDKELIVVKGKVIEQQKSYSPDSGKEISYEAGAKMVKRHYDENPDDVIAHFFGRNVIERVLLQPGCVGIRMFHGTNELGIRKLIFVGVDERGNNILTVHSLGMTPNLSQKEGVIISDIKLCPPYCAGTDTITVGW